MASVSWRRCLMGIAAACVLAVLAALIGQYYYDMRPCPYCILQRFLFLVIALVAMVAAVVRLPTVRAAMGGAIVLLAGCTGAAAVYQHVVAAHSVSCNLTFADKVITALKLETLVPDLFGVTASCADAAVSVLKIPFEYWSLMLSVAIVVTALYALRRVSR